MLACHSTSPGALSCLLLACYTALCGALEFPKQHRVDWLFLFTGCALNIVKKTLWIGCCLACMFFFYKKPKFMDYVLCFASMSHLWIGCCLMFT